MTKSNITISDIKNSACASLNKHLFEENKKSKYNNVKVEVDGEKIDSKGEAKRYKELRIALKAGKIGFLARQVQFELNPGGTHSLIYIADFYYVDIETGNKYVEDYKGMETKEFKKKEKLMKKIFDVTIKKTK